MTGDMADIAATLATERMTLRPLRRSDAGPMSLYAGDRRVAEMLENVPHPYFAPATIFSSSTTPSGTSSDGVASFLKWSWLLG